MHRGYLSPTVEAICLLWGEQLEGGGAIYYLLSVLTLSRSPVVPRNGSCVSFMTNHNRHIQCMIFWHQFSALFPSADLYFAQT